MSWLRNGPLWVTPEKIVDVPLTALVLFEDRLLAGAINVVPHHPAVPAGQAAEFDTPSGIRTLRKMLAVLQRDHRSDLTSGDLGRASTGRAVDVTAPAIAPTAVPRRLSYRSAAPRPSMTTDTAIRTPSRTGCDRLSAWTEPCTVAGVTRVPSLWSPGVSDESTAC